MWRVSHIDYSDLNDLWEGGREGKLARDASRMQEPWHQGLAPDSSPSSPIPHSATTTLTTLTALDLVKPRQPSAFHSLTHTD